MAGMTSSGKRLALLIGAVIGLALPMRVECGYAGAKDCSARTGKWRTMCTAYELEPFLFYALESAFGRDIGFAYETGEDCR
jgi:hypothetical protein